MKLSTLVFGVSVIVILTVAAIHRVAHGDADVGEEQKVFNYVDIATTELTATQQKTLSKLKEEPTASSLQIVKLSSQAFDGEAVSLNLADGQSTRARRIKKVNRNKGFLWVGMDDKSLPTVNLSIQEGNGYGSFVADGTTYNLRPLGNGLHALIKRDSSKINEKEEPPAFKKIEKESEKKNVPKGNPRAESSARFDVDVMVLYTPTVSGNHPVISDFVDHVFEVSNNCFLASGVPVNLRLAKLQQVDYAESNDVAKDVERITGKHDGYLDGVHALRDQSHADIVVLLIDHADAYGMAAAIMADESEAFAVVDDEVADWYFTFAHELGHLFGCRHNPEADPTMGPFPYGHCHCNASKQWRTIMSYDCTGQSQRIGLWSSPLLKNPPNTGDPAGDSTTRDNCRVLRETASIISAFR
jgi:hypothetical protein